MLIRLVTAFCLAGLVGCSPADEIQRFQFSSDTELILRHCHDWEASIPVSAELRRGGMVTDESLALDYLDPGGLRRWKATFSIETLYGETVGVVRRDGGRGRGGGADGKILLLVDAAEACLWPSRGPEDGPGHQRLRKLYQQISDEEKTWRE